LTLPAFQIQRETYVSEKGATNDQHQREGGAALTKRDGQERPLFESLEDCQAAIGLLTRRDAVEVLQAMDPSQRRRLVEAFGRLSGGENKKREMPAPSPVVQEDRNVKVHEASRLIGYSTTWIYHHHKELPFTRRSKSGRLRFSAKGIQEWLKNNA